MARSAADVRTASRHGQAPRGAVPTQTPSRGKLGVALKTFMPDMNAMLQNRTCNFKAVKYDGAQSECKRSTIQPEGRRVSSHSLPAGLSGFP